MFDISERMERRADENWTQKEEDSFCKRIVGLLNDPGIGDFPYVDAFYYDFSVLPDGVQGVRWRDSYLIFGIRQDGSIAYKFVDRWELDSEDPIINGEVKEK